jgi:hypothetical protein
MTIFSEDSGTPPGGSVWSEFLRRSGRRLGGPRGPRLVGGGTATAAPPQLAQLDQITKLVYEELLLPTAVGRATILVVPVEAMIHVHPEDFDRLEDAGLAAEDGRQLGRTVVRLLGRYAPAGDIIKVPPGGLALHVLPADYVRRGVPEWAPPSYIRPCALEAALVSVAQPGRKIPLEPFGRLRVCQGMFEEFGLPLDGQVSTTRHAVIETNTDGSRGMRVVLEPVGGYYSAVNDRQVTAPVELRDGDRVRFGGTDLVLRWDWRFGAAQPAQERDS